MTRRSTDTRLRRAPSPHRPLRSPIEMALVAAICVLLPLVVFLATPVNEHNGGRDADGVHYAAMATASDSAEARTAPFCWRPLTPLLSAALPFPPLESFEILAGLGCVLSLIFLDDVLRSMSIPPLFRCFALLLYAGVFWTLKFSFYSPFYVDAETQALLLLILSLMLRLRFFSIASLMPLAVMQKESLLALAPVVFAHYWAVTSERFQRRIWILAALLVPGALTLVVLRHAIHPVNSYSTARALGGAVAQLARPRVWPRMTAELFSGLGVLPALLALEMPRAWRFIRTHPPWALQLAIGAVLVFGGPEKGRLLLFVLPALVVTVAAAFGSAPSHPYGSGVMIAVLVLHFYVGHHLTPMGTFAEYRQRMVPIHSPESVAPSLARGIVPNLLVLALGWSLRRNRSRASDGGE